MCDIGEAVARPPSPCGGESGPNFPVPATRLMAPSTARRKTVYPLLFAMYRLPAPSYASGVSVPGTTLAPSFANDEMDVDVPSPVISSRPSRVRRATLPAGLTARPPTAPPVELPAYATVA